mmetsp:Transcript_60857/g.162822  ORF Transcript_60857/g.162822 Transcript_60857/m.162822 type:complete len:89 (-) Transcript_60857:183-449(-)
MPCFLEQRCHVLLPRGTEDGDRSYGVTRSGAIPYALWERRRGPSGSPRLGPAGGAGWPVRLVAGLAAAVCVAAAAVGVRRGILGSHVR